MPTNTHSLRWWGFGGAIPAAIFAVWLLFFPDLALTFFAWSVEPRMAQIFIGAGYIFRTGFFLTVALTPQWHRIRWIFWGNLVFTGTLLFATFWNLQSFNWFSPVAHIWIILYVIEPILMIYGVPRDAASWNDVPTPRGPISRGLKWLLILQVMILFTFGAILVLNPTFADLRWPWALNPLDAQIVAAWFLGWAVWAGTMAFARDWDEIRTGARLNILFGLALILTFILFFPVLDFTRMTTTPFVGGVIFLTAAMIFFYWWQEWHQI